MAAQGSVEVLTGLAAGRRFELTPAIAAVTVGADAEAGVVIAGDPGMAPFHFLVTLEPEFCLVEAVGEVALCVDGRRAISTCVEESGTVQAGTTLFEVRFRPEVWERTAAEYGFAAVTALREAGERCCLVVPDAQAGELGLKVISVDDQEAEAAELLSASWDEDLLSVWMGPFEREELCRHFEGLAPFAGGAEGLRALARPGAQQKFGEGLDAESRAAWFGPATGIMVEAFGGQSAIVLERDGGRRWLDLSF